MTYWGNAAADWAWLRWRLRLAWARHAEAHARWCLQIALLTARSPDDAEIQGLAAVVVYATNHRRRLELNAP